MLNDIVRSKIDQANIGLFIGLYKPLAKMIDGGKTVVIIRFSEIGIVEQRVVVIAVALFPIFLQKTRLAKANKELWISPRNLVLK